MTSGAIILEEVRIEHVDGGVLFSCSYVLTKVSSDGLPIRAEVNGLEEAELVSGKKLKAGMVLSYLISSDMGVGTAKTKRTTTNKCDYL